MNNKKNIDWFEEKMKAIQSQMSHSLLLKKGINPQIETIRIIGVYILMGCLWILFSDKILNLLIQDHDLLLRIQTYKGWFYVLLTGGLFYFVLLKRIVLFKGAIDTIYENYEDLTTSHEELIAMEEELNQQYDELRKHYTALQISDQRYQLAVEGANEGIWDWDIKNGVYFFSIKWKASFGFKNDEIENTFDAWKDMLHPEDREKSVKMVDDYLLSKKGIYENIYRLRCKDGSYRWILSRGKAIWDEEGSPVRVAGSHTDITGQIRLQEYLQAEKNFSDSIIRHATMLILILDKNFQILRFNPFAETITGYKEEEVVGKYCIDLFIPPENKQYVEDNLQKIKEDRVRKKYETKIVTKNGKLLDILWNTDILQDQNKKVSMIIAIGIDITERKEMEQKLHSLAYYDPLTTLPNRTMFENELEKRITTSQKKSLKMALIYFDIDNFKHINDTLGHGAGDQLLKYVANTLKNHIQSPNFCARLGGDEFVIVLDHITDTNDVILCANQIQEHLSKAWIIENHEFFISISMGLALYPDNGDSLKNLLQNADTAMFEVKEHGKNAYQFYTDRMKEKTLKYIESINQLRHAIEQEEFSLYYQPQINIHTGEIIGLEALIRWIHPTKGFIPPMDFIPLAEKTEYIHPIGQWVIKTACIQRKRWEEKGYHSIKVSINLSSKRIAEKDLVENIRWILENYHIKSGDIEIEITETFLMADTDNAIEKIHQLKSLGVSIALDDFGTGYSSLTYLRKLPIDVLKIDRSFITDMMDKNKSTYMVETIIQLAHHMNLKVVAEGIETPEQLDTLKELGCDIGQGYYFSRPMPVHETDKYLEQNYLP